MGIVANNGKGRKEGVEMMGVAQEFPDIICSAFNALCICRPAKPKALLKTQNSGNGYGNKSNI